MKKWSILIGLVAIVAVANAQSYNQNNDDVISCNHITNAVRRIISIPDIDGYKTLKCDFHMHTVFADAQVSPLGRVREAWNHDCRLSCSHSGRDDSGACG